MTKSPLGGLLIDKPPGPTSHDIIDHVRRTLRLRRVGHTGTLDPFASGLLLVLLGSATRLAEYLHDFPKTYTATIVLGATSTTDDATGEITSTNSHHQPDRGQLLAALAQLQTTTTQTPPAYAAIKFQGQRLYDIARKQGSNTASKLAQQKSRPITIHTLSLTRYTYPEADIVVTVSTGTYIRSIVRDLGILLNTGAYTKSLRRTQIGAWNEQKAIKPENLKNDAEWFSQHLMAPADLVVHLPTIKLQADNVAKLQQGIKVPLVDNLSTFPTNKPLAVQDHYHRLVGIATLDRTTSLLSPTKILPTTALDESLS